MKEKFFKVKSMAEVIPCSLFINNEKHSQIDDLRKKYDCDAKFRAIVDFMFDLIVNEQITPFELSQALTSAFLMYEEMVLRPLRFKLSPRINALWNNEK